MKKLGRIGKNIGLGLLGGIGCAICWALIDRYLFNDVADARYYIGVVFAYLAGTGPFSNA